MSTSSNSNTQRHLPPDTQRQKRTPIPRQPPSRIFFKKRAILIAFVILIVGYANLAPSSALGIVIQSERTKGVTELIIDNADDDLSIQSTPTAVVQPFLKIFPKNELPTFRNVSTPVPISLRQSTFSSEPTVIPTSVAFEEPPSLQLASSFVSNTVGRVKVAQAVLSTLDQSEGFDPADLDITLGQKLDLLSFSKVTNTPTPIPAPIPAATTSLPAVSPTSTLTATLQSEIKHVVIISVDGLRPDALFLANTPHLDDLIAKGAYSPDAQTVSLSRTLPSHASMLTGMTPDKHGVLWGMPYIGWPGMNGPTLFNVAHDAGLYTAMAVGKEKFSYLVLPNSVDDLFCADAHDLEVKDEAVEFIEAGLPNVLLIHFPDTDRVGHTYGWMSSNQLQSVTYVDGMIGEVVAALESGGYLNTTLLIVSADHGGHGLGHGDDSPLDRTIPWLAVGPGVSSGITIGTDINTFDTAATTLYALDLPIPEKWDGQPVLEIFNK